MPVRLLTPLDRAEIAAHYLALDADSRRLRFFAGVGDAFIRDYCARIDWLSACVLASFEGRTITGVAELARLPAPHFMEAEIALSVQAAYRRQGVGADLLRHALALARNRFIAHVTLLCLPENVAMRRLALRFGALLSTEPGAITGRILPPWPSYSTLLDEAVSEGQTLLQAAFDLALRPKDAA